MEQSAKERAADAIRRSEEKMCGCDRPDKADDPHRHEFDVACLYFQAGSPTEDRIRQVLLDRGLA